MRTVKEWIGKSDDAMPPPTVRLRIWQTHKGVCHLCGQKIQVGEKWDASHLKSIWDDGENRESNYAPAHVKCHTRHSAKETKERADTRRVQMKHIGIRPRSKMQARGFQKAPPQHTATRPYNTGIKETVE